MSNNKLYHSRSQRRRNTSGCSCLLYAEGINSCKWVLRSNYSSVFVGGVRKPFPDDWETCQLLTQEIKHTGRNPTGNLSGRPAILPEKQMLLFLWSVANRELNCIVRAPTLGRETKPDISCEWNTKFSIIPEIPTNRVHSKRIPKFSKTFPGIFTVPFNFEPEISEFLVEWKAPTF